MWRLLSEERLLGHSSPQTARAHHLGGWGPLPSRRSQPKERLWGISAPNGGGPRAGGTGSPIHAVVAVQRAPIAG